MNKKEVIEMQYRVLVLTEKLGIDSYSQEFKDFKHRIFENVQFIKDIKSN